MTAIRPEDVAEWHDEGRGDDGNLYFCIMLKDGRTVDRLKDALQGSPQA